MMGMRGPRRRAGQGHCRVRAEGGARRAAIPASGPLAGVGQMLAAIADHHAPGLVVELEVDLQTVVGGASPQGQVTLHLEALVAVVEYALRSVLSHRGLT